MKTVFSNLLIIHEASTKKINTVENVQKSEEEITYMHIRPVFSWLAFSQNAASLEKNVLVKYY